MIKGAEKRRFPRRNVNLACDLIVAGESTPAVITDFPLTGLGMLLKGKSDLPTLKALQSA
jgi:hypothetical protein